MNQWRLGLWQRLGMRMDHDKFKACPVEYDCKFLNPSGTFFQLLLLWSWIHRCAGSGAGCGGRGAGLHALSV